MNLDVRHEKSRSGPAVRRPRPYKVRSRRQRKSRRKTESWAGRAGGTPAEAHAHPLLSSLTFMEDNTTVLPCARIQIPSLPEEGLRLPLMSPSNSRNNRKATVLIHNSSLKTKLVGPAGRGRGALSLHPLAGRGGRARLQPRGPGRQAWARRPRLLLPGRRAPGGGSGRR